MPKCKNDKTRSFKGTEPSPKGLGWCAHGMKVGAVKKGKDGREWEVSGIKNGSKRWMKVNEYDINKLYEYLKNKIHNWWYELSIGGLLVIYNNKKYKLIKYKKKTLLDKIKNKLFKKNQSNDEEWNNLKNNKDIKYILWSSRSYDNLDQFINFILEKSSIKIIEDFIKQKDTLKLISNNFTKLCNKYYMYSNKDYVLKGTNYKNISNNKNINKILKKLLKSKVIKQKM
jgi:hypothetical protein